MRHLYLLSLASLAALAVLFAMSPAPAETCLSPFVKRLDRREKVRHRELVLNIKDVQKLRLRVAPGGDGSKDDLGLHLDLADAKVSK